MTPEEQVARVTAIEHPIIGTEYPLMAPERLVQCLSCGWMPCSEYGNHLAAEVVKALRLRRETHACEFDGLMERYVSPWQEVKS